MGLKTAKRDGSFEFGHPKGRVRMNDKKTYQNVDLYTIFLLALFRYFFLSKKCNLLITSAAYILVFSLILHLLPHFVRTVKALERLYK